MKEMTGGEALVEMLSLHGVELAFGMGGFQPLPYYDAIARQSALRHVLIRDEKHGAFAADAYARVTNRPAIADATLGPGATNLLSGAAESQGASVPLILLTADVNREIKGRSATQETDQFQMLAPAVKHSVTISSIARIPEQVRRAINLSTSGRPGPVNINIPEEVFHGSHDFDERDFYADPAATRVGGRRIRADQADIDRAAALISRAKRPLLLLGGGIHLSEAYEQLANLLEVRAMPVATTIGGKGSIAENHPLSAGVFGRFSRFANDLIGEADLLVVIGCKLGEISTNRWSLLPEGVDLVHIDIDPGELGKVYGATVGIWADAASALADLAQAVDPQPDHVRSDVIEEVANRRARWLEDAMPILESDDEPIVMGRVLNELQQALPEEAIVVADGGFAAHWSAILYECRFAGRGYIANRGQAAIGYGAPGAIGAKLARPDVPVVALCGDNGFAMAIAEVETAKRVGANVLFMVVNNETLGYVKALQHGIYDDRFVSVDFLPVDYAAIARGFGCDGQVVTSPDALAEAIAAGLASDVPHVLDVRITTDPSKMLPGVDSRTRIGSS